MGIGIAEGDKRATEAAQRAVNSPLLDISINGAKGILFVVCGSDDLGIMEVQEAAKVINESVDKNARVIFGMMKDDNLKKGQIRIIVIATGFPEGATSQTSTERSLFSAPAVHQQEERGRIYHEVIKRPVALPVISEEKEPEPEQHLIRAEREEPIVTARPARPDLAAPTPVVVEEDDSWGAIPNFLRRHKK